MLPRTFGWTTRQPASASDSAKGDQVPRFTPFGPLKTLAVRMERHCDNAERVVDLLLAHPKVSSV
ncbi:hypothetical protein, partial [Streptosporangium sandarakinum]|uniref:hypothetical protein n=1 Tax=Streptosporangium sandarakinum TaxID=1260955 RepID=UPI0033B150B5